VRFAPAKPGLGSYRSVGPACRRGRAVLAQQVEHRPEHACVVILSIILIQTHVGARDPRRVSQHAGEIHA
jgi:hypothetical protein